MPLQQTFGNVTADAYGGGVAAVPNYIEDVFSTYLYTGTGSAITINNGIDLSTKGGLVWIKNRTGAQSHNLYDTARGRAYRLASQSTAAQTGPSGSTNDLTSFNTNGFSLGTEQYSNTNDSAFTYASWTFRKQPKFFDVVTFTAGTSTNQRISHSLGSVPGCIIIKCTSTTSGWYVYHRSLGRSQYVRLNATSNAVSSTDIWGTSDPTSTDFGVNAPSLLEGAGTTYVAYVFAHNAGGFGLTGTDNVISCGSYTGGSIPNAKTLGYEPQWIMVKRTDSTGNWVVFDNMRGMSASSSSASYLYPNLSDAESSGSNGIGATATGFEFYGTNSDINSTTPGTYIYIAIRRGPMKVPTDGTKVFAPVTYTGTGSSSTQVVTTFAPDMVWPKNRGGSDSYAWTRLQGLNGLVMSDTSAEAALTNRLTSWNQTGITLGTAQPNNSGDSYILEGFKRAPSFFDEVCYTGTGANRTVSHNLAAVPELMIIKDRSVGEDWTIYSQTLATNQALKFTTAAREQLSNYWNTTRPTSSVFSVGDYAGVNSSGDNYVAYLFATCAGVSKVGSYTGNGTTQTINCGFTGGSRLVLIKRTDSTGNWVIWDTARGMVSGTDPRLELNTTNAETNANWVYTTTGGFQIVTSDANVNASGGSYIYFSVAQT